jgi:galactose mutarotase-like enzyme
MQTLKNEMLTIQVSEHGAELQSIRKDDYEYLWQGNPEYWGRRSPVLFPIVGSVWEKCFRVDGKVYEMGQHGFARDMDFELVSAADTEVWYRLESSEKTLAAYPWPFVLEIGYRLEGNSVTVLWKVTNPGETEMYFQIGAHPAFNYPGYDPDAVDRGVVAFDRNDNLQRSGFKGKGCVDPQARFPIHLSDDGMLRLKRDTFDDIDTLMLENDQVHKVVFLKNDSSPYLTVTFDAPVVAIWSPPKRNAPFFCIEPWYGRCDRADYTGEFKDRDWVNALAPGATFAASYTITLD